MLDTPSSPSHIPGAFRSARRHWKLEASRAARRIEHDHPARTVQCFAPVSCAKPGPDQNTILSPPCPRYRMQGVSQKQRGRPRIPDGNHYLRSRIAAVISQSQIPLLSGLLWSVIADRALRRVYLLISEVDGQVIVSGKGSRGLLPSWLRTGPGDWTTTDLRWWLTIVPHSAVIHYRVVLAKQPAVATATPSPCLAQPLLCRSFIAYGA